MAKKGSLQILETQPFIQVISVKINLLNKEQLR